MVLAAAAERVSSSRLLAVVVRVVMLSTVLRIRPAAVQQLRVLLQAAAALLVRLLAVAVRQAARVWVQALAAAWVVAA
jgi:hypothetical protein